MSKRMEMHRLLGDLRYQLAPGAHTYSQCSRVSCDNGARGGRVCSECLEFDIDRLIHTPGAGTKVGAAIAEYHDLQEDMLEMAEDQE